MEQEIGPPDLLPQAKRTTIQRSIPISSYYAMKPEARDEITFLTEQNGLVKDIDLLYSTKLFRRFMLGYLIGLICEYSLIFLSLPFESIHGRPSLCVIQVFYFLFSCISGFFLYLKGSAIVPSKWSYLANVWSVIFQFIGVVLTAITFIVVETAAEKFRMVTEENHMGVKQYVYMTEYVCWISFLCVLATLFTFICTLAMTIVYGKGYYRLSNRIHKLTTKVLLQKRQFNGIGENISLKSVHPAFEHDMECQTITKEIEDFIEERFS